MHFAGQVTGQHFNVKSTSDCDVNWNRFGRFQMMGADLHTHLHIWEVICIACSLWLTCSDSQLTVMNSARF